MHGPSYGGDCEQALHELGAAYDERFTAEGTRLHGPVSPVPDLGGAVGSGCHEQARLLARNRASVRPPQRNEDEVARTALGEDVA